MSMIMRWCALHGEALFALATMLELTNTPEEQIGWISLLISPPMYGLVCIDDKSAKKPYEERCVLDNSHFSGETSSYKHQIQSIHDHRRLGLPDDVIARRKWIASQYEGLGGCSRLISSAS
jgi:hypothetical protein